MILAGAGELGAAAPAPYDKSLIEAFLGASPGFISRELQTIKTLFVVSIAVTVGMGLAVMATTPRR